MLPFRDVRVIAIEQFGAGPWGTMQLADLGAEIIKIEDVSVGGDVGRHVPPFAADGTSLFFETFNRNKRSVSLDLRNPSGREIFEMLVRNSDAVFSNLRGDGRARLGICYEDSQRSTRALCVLSLWVWLDWATCRQGANDVTIQALAGWMSVTAVQVSLRQRVACRSSTSPAAMSPRSHSSLVSGRHGARAWVVVSTCHCLRPPSHC